MEQVEVCYCSCCGWPVHYCRYRKPSKQAELGCEAALRKENEELWRLIYAKDIAPSAGEQGDGAKEGNVEDDPSKENKGDEDSRDTDGEKEGEEDGDNDEEVEPEPEPGLTLAYEKAKVLPFGVPIKPHIKKQQGYVPVLQIRFAARGTHKGVTQVFNYDDFPVDVKEVMATLRKSLACAVSETVLDQLGGTVITVQGKYEREVGAIFVTAGVPKANIFYAVAGKNTKRKRR